MSLHTSGGQHETPAAPARPQTQPRLAMMDRDPGMLHVLAKQLHAAGWASRVLPSAASPEALLAMRLSALVIDIALLGQSAFDYLERVRARLPSLAVVVCTGPSSVAQRVRGLRAGADAWLSKPLHPEELIAVAEATSRRQRQHALPVIEPAVTFGEVTIRPHLREAYAGATSLDLTAKEFEILRLLSQYDGVLRREEIYERVWGYAMARGDRSVDVFVRKLRQKLGACSPSWHYISTHFGIGYRLAPERIAINATAGQDAPAPVAADEEELDGARPVRLPA